MIDQKKLKIDLHQLLSGLSMAMDYNRGGLMRHHQRVALLALYMAEELKLPQGDYLRLFCSAVVHDAGTSTFREKAELEHFEANNPWSHCQKGYALLNKTSILAPLAEIILHHHDNWNGDNTHGVAKDSIPLASRIIHLADRVDVLAQQPGFILDHRNDIIKKIQSNAGTMFDPDLVETFTNIAEKECLWLDLVSPIINKSLEQRMLSCPVTVSPDDLKGISLIFAEIIDGKSPFTFRHSRLVAEVSAFLARKAGFQPGEQQDMYVAGLLHDLGKLSIPEEILEKPGVLTKQEFNIIKQHTYITHQILGQVNDFEQINQWASYHHEKINGQGYPFRLPGELLSTGSRIMAVADIFCALVEDRPYRKGLTRDKVEKILLDQAQSLNIDRLVVELLLDHYLEAQYFKDITSATKV